MAQTAPDPVTGSKISTSGWGHKVYTDLVDLYATTATLTAARALRALKLTDSITPVNNSTALVDDPDLRLTVAANTTYDLNLQVTYSTGATPDIKFAWSLPAGTTMPANMAHFYNGSWVAGPVNDTSTLVCEGFATDLPMRWSGLLIVGGTPGVLQLRFAQNTANATNTLLRAGSYMRLLPVV